MKKTLLVTAFLALLLPNIVMAAWWNPFTWFDNWEFFDTEQVDTQAAVLEARIQELEAKLDELATTTATSSVEVQSEIIEKEQPAEMSIPRSTPPAPVAIPQIKAPVVTAAPAVPKDFRAECTPSREELTKGHSVRATIKVYYERLTDFTITWDETHLEKVLDVNEALFAPNDHGKVNLTATVTRKSDGYSKPISCVVDVERVKSEERPELSECEVLDAELEILWDERIDVNAEYDARIAEVSKNPSGVFGGALNDQIRQLRTEQDQMEEALNLEIAAKQSEFARRCD